MAVNLGSVFLGDARRNRIFGSSSSTPPTSPRSPNAMSHSSTSNPALPSSPPAISLSSIAPETTKKSSIDPQTALELRLRWLEALLVGVKERDKERARERVKTPEWTRGESMLHLADELRGRLEALVAGNDGLKRFMDHYDQHASLLTPAFALETQLPEESTSPEELDALLGEMDPDIRAADRDMREIEQLVQKGVISAGHLPDYDELKPRLTALVKSHEDDMARADKLEQKMASLMQKHATHVDALSELFVEWDDTLTTAEDSVVRLERDHADRRRFGLEE